MCRYEKEYTPLLPEDVENEPPPRRPTKDAYLDSRLARFYAELAQYQPGQDRAMYESKLQTMGDGLLPPPVAKCADLFCSLCYGRQCMRASCRRWATACFPSRRKVRSGLCLDAGACRGVSSGAWLLERCCYVDASDFAVAVGLLADNGHW